MKTIAHLRHVLVSSLMSCIAASAPPALAAPPAPSSLFLPPERTLTMDPIELIAGRETPGKADLAVEHDGIEYRFATAESKAAFVKEPAKYEVADGGACGRMGPLSGLGDARRYAVHAGRIYFFASDGCREGFLKDPARHIETDDEIPFGSHEQVLQGRATLDKLVAWAGGAGGAVGGKVGAERLKALSSYRASAARTVKQGEKEWAVTNETAIAFPASYFQKEAWNASWFSTMSAGELAAMASTRGEEKIAASRRRAFNRTMARWPVVILKAYVDGAPPKADCPGFVVIGDGEGKLDDTPVEFAKVWLNGAASRLAVEKSTGRLLQLEFHGRDSTMKVGAAARRYTKYATVEGITLPTAYTVTFEGKDLPSAAATIDTFEVNAKLPEDQFKLKK